MSATSESTIAGRLSDSDAHYREIFENTSDCMFLIDVTVEGGFRIAHFNPATERIFGQPNARIAGKLVEEVLSADATAEVRLWYGKCVALGTSVSYEENLPSANGNLWFETTLIPIKDAANRVHRIVGTTRNTTESRKLQEQVLTSDRMASVGMLAASIVHEINNPLAAIMANLYLAVERATVLAAGDDPRMRALQEELSDSMASAERIRNIVRDVGIFSRCNDHAAHPVELQPVIESSLRIACNELRHRVTVVRDYGSGVMPVAGDESRLGQVFLNLIVNAAQSFEEGQASTHQITVSTRMAGNQVVAEIRDSGAGIAPAHLARLFTPFFTTKSSGVGTGLGLSISQRIVNDLGGTIVVESVLGQGSIFRVLLPSSAAPIPIAPVLPVAVEPARRGHVLIVDDERLIGSVARRILATEHTVTVTNSAREAFTWIREGQTFDVILCDLMMPDLDGIDLFLQLQQLRPALAEHVVFMTGGAFTARASKFLAEVPNSRIGKPFDPASLRNAINRQLA